MIDVSTGVVPKQERSHEESRLFRFVGMFRADRAGATGAAAKAHAIRAGRASKMARAPGDIVVAVA
jgi:hypothetical protein